MDTIGLWWDKVAHLRKAATEKCGRWGLDSSIIATVTKHKMQGMSVLDTHYMTELHPKALACLSGTTFHDYFVPCTQISFDPDDWDDDLMKQLLQPYGDLVKRIFPMHDQFIDQIESSRAEPGKAARNFVYMLIPYLANVIAQDGIYFTQYFPDHPASIFITTNDATKLPTSREEDA
jgi:hypothetical protein